MPPNETTNGSPTNSSSTGGPVVSDLSVVGSVQQVMKKSVVVAAHDRVYANQSTSFRVPQRTIDFWSVDISEASVPTLAGEVDVAAFSNEALDVLSASPVDNVLYGNSVGLTGGCVRGLVAIDVSNLSAISVQPVWQECATFFLSPSLALIMIPDPNASNLPIGYQILDLSGATPQLRGTITTTALLALPSAGNRVVFWQPFGVADISNLDAPVMLNTPTDDPSAKDTTPSCGVLSKDGNWAYVEDFSNLWVIDLRVLASVSFTSFTSAMARETLSDTDWDNTLGAALSPNGQRLVTSWMDGLDVFDITDPSSPKLLADGAPGAPTFSADGSLLYVSGPMGFQIVSVP